MADNETYIDLRNRLLEKTSRINTLAEILSYTKTPSTLKEFKQLYDAAIEAKDLAETAFNDMMQTFIDAHQTLFGATFAELYARRANDDCDIIFNSLRIMNLVNSDETKSVINQTYKALTYLVDAKIMHSTPDSQLTEDQMDARKVVQSSQNFFEKLEEDVYKYFGTIPPANQDELKRLDKEILEKRRQLTAAGQTLAALQRASSNSNVFLQTFHYSPKILAKSTELWVTSLGISRLEAERIKLISEKIDDPHRYVYYLEKLVEYNTGTSFYSDKAECLFKMGEGITSFNNGLMQVVNTGGNHAIDCLRSWQYIHQARQNIDKDFNPEYLNDIESQMNDVCDNILTLSSMNIDEISSYNTLVDNRVKLKNSLEKMLTSIDDIKLESFDTIKLINGEKENYEVLFKFNKKYGSLIEEGLMVIDSILRSEIRPSDQTIDAEVTIGDLMEDENAAATFNGTKFIYPIQYDQMQRTDGSFWAFYEWENMLVKKIGLRDQISNLCLTYLSTYITDLIPRGYAKYVPTVYPEIAKYAVTNVLDKKMMQNERSATAIESIQKYENLKNDIKELKRTYGIEVNEDFDSERIMTSLKILLPELEVLDFIKFEDTLKNVYDDKTSLNADFDRFLKFVCYKALLKQKKQLKTLIPRIRELLVADSFESIKTLYLRHVLYTAMNELTGDSDSDTTYTDIVKKYYTIYLDLSNTDVNRFIYGTNYYKFLNHQYISSQDNDVVVPPKITTKDTLSLDVLAVLSECTENDTTLANIERINKLFYTTVIADPPEPETEEDE